MRKREFKINLKSFVIWTSILVGMFLVVFLIYPFIVTDETVKNLDEVLKVFPKELLKSFNMDITSINTAYGWLKSEGFMFILLIVGFYASLSGANILLKEENDKTIEYLESLPIKRSKIITDKLISSLIYIISLIIIIGLFNYVALLLSGDFNQKEYILLSFTPLLIALPLYAINLFISTFMHKTKKTIGISLGFVFIFYLLNVLSELSESVSILKYFSIYTLADIRHVILNNSINPINIIISVIITVLFISGTYIRYNKKELID